MLLIRAAYRLWNAQQTKKQYLHDTNALHILSDNTDIYRNISYGGYTSAVLHKLVWHALLWRHTRPRRPLLRKLCRPSSSVKRRPSQVMSTWFDRRRSPSDWVSTFALVCEWGLARGLSPSSVELTHQAQHRSGAESAIYDCRGSGGRQFITLSVHFCKCACGGRQVRRRERPPPGVQLTHRGQHRSGAESAVYA